MANQMEKLFQLSSSRATTLNDIADNIKEIVEINDYDKDILVFKGSKDTREILKLLWFHLYLMNETDFKSIKRLKDVFENFICSNDWDDEKGKVLHPLRVALSGQKNSPNPFELMWALGKEWSLIRLQSAFQKLA